jgi:hypothetical protein
MTPGASDNRVPKGEAMTTTSEPQEQRREESATEEELALADLELQEEGAREIAGGTRGGCDAVY